MGRFIATDNADDQLDKDCILHSDSEFYYFRNYFTPSELFIIFLFVPQNTVKLISVANIAEAIEKILVDES